MHLSRGHQLASQVGTHQDNSHGEHFVAGWGQRNLLFERNLAFIEIQFVFFLLQYHAVQNKAGSRKRHLSPGTGLCLGKVLVADANKRQAEEALG